MRESPRSIYLLRCCAILAALTLAACGRSNFPAPIVFGDQQNGSSQGAPSYRPPAPGPQTAIETPVEPVQPWPVTGVTIVRPGDTLFRISRRFGVPVQGLIHRNRLSAPYDLRPGQRLVLPRAKSHVVTKTDTVFGLSKHYGVPMADLVRLNRVRPPYRISVGQRLLIPQAVDPATTTQVAASRPLSVPRYVLPAPVPEPASPRPRFYHDRTPPARAGRGFLWPLRGRILIGFGSRGKGLRNDGINIAAKRGTPVKAAENGVVAYSGNQLRGFGNLILLKHAGGWTSAYAHNSRLLVRTGQRVRRGQTISLVGRTGNVLRPQLHFELRRGESAVDPSKYLILRTARTKGLSPAFVPTARRDPG